MLSKPAKARLLFEAVREAMVDLPRLPVSASFPFSRLQDAIDHMAAGKHIGKVLVKTEAALAVSPRRRNARYVVSAMAAADSKGAKSTVDPVAAALQRRLWRPHSPDDGGVLVARLGAFGSLRLAAFDSAVASSNARVVITDSRLLARRALKLGATLAVELRGLEAWRGMSRRDLRRAMQLHGHVVGGVCDAVADSGRDCANVVLRLVSDQSKELDAGVALRSDFETLGLDSLSLITLAQRLTAALKRSVTVAMLQRSGSAERLIAELSGDAKPVRRANRGAARAAVRPPPRKRILCLHGYRSSAEIMQLQLFPFARALADYDFVYVDAPLRATGESEPSIPPETPTFEWYGAPGADYDFGWETGDDGLEASLRAVREYVSSGQFCGVVGFSQGAAIAQLLSSPEQTRANGLEWVALFSAIPSPQVAEAKLVVPSFHCYDDGEPHAHLARQVRDAFVSSRTWLHEEGHYVSRVPDVIRAFADFVRSPQPPCPEPTTAFVRSPQPRKSSNGPPPPRPDESDDEANE